MRSRGAERESDEMPRVLEESLERSMPSRLRLPFAFDAAALASEALAFDESAWIAHFNKAYYEGDWSGLPLRSKHGWLTLFPDVTGTAPYLDTPYLDRCPAIRAGLAVLGCETMSVRLLRLGAGARVLEHQDYNIGLDYGFVRLHVPVVTGAGVEFILGGEPLVMAAGECWYVDVWNAHRVMNPGPAARIHLVVDCVVDPPFLAMMNAALPPPS
jgi:hypothetical protein